VYIHTREVYPGYTHQGGIYTPGYTLGREAKYTRVHLRERGYTP